MPQTANHAVRLSLPQKISRLGERLHGHVLRRDGAVERGHQVGASGGRGPECREDDECQLVEAIHDFRPSGAGGKMGTFAGRGKSTRRRESPQLESRGNLAATRRARANRVRFPDTTSERIDGVAERNRRDKPLH